MRYTLNDSQGVLHVSLPGDVLSTNVDSLSKSFTEMLNSSAVSAGRWTRMVLDLSQAKMVDSMGLNLIVSLVRQVKNRGARLEVRISNANIHRTFLFTRIDQQVDLVMAASAA